MSNCTHVMDTPLSTVFDKKGITKWCKDTCQGEYTVELWYVIFEKEADAIMFKLKFGE